MEGMNADVRNILSCVEGLGRDYLEHWSKQLAIESLYREVSK